MKTSRRFLLLALPFALGALLWPVARETRRREGTRELFALMDVYRYKEKQAEAAIAKGADLNARGPDGRTLLILAIDGYNLKLMDLLIKRGADVNAPAVSGWTPLMKAVSKLEPEVVHVLLASGAKPFAKTPNGMNTRQFVASALKERFPETLPKEEHVDGTNRVREILRLLRVIEARQSHKFSAPTSQHSRIRKNVVQSVVLFSTIEAFTNSHARREFCQPVR